jgi:hypothetical protein
MTECVNFKSDAGGGDLGAEKLLRGDFFEEYGLYTKPCSRVGHFSVCRDQLRGAQFQGSGNMNPVKCSQKKRRLRLDGSRGDVLGAGFDINA